MRIVNIYNSTHIYISYCFGIIINKYWHIDGDIHYMEDNSYIYNMQYDDYNYLHFGTPNGCPVMIYSSGGRLLINGRYSKSAEYI